jgi:arylsulfatase A-like enzyme
LIERRNFIRSLAVAPPLLAPARDVNARSASDTRPNFLFLIADDLTYRSIQALNNPEVHTPYLDRLVHSGCAFTHCFHQGSSMPAVCVPSRTMLNSGLSAFRAQAQLDWTPLWGQTLGNAGYDTYIVGKWHLDPTSLQRSFKEMGPVGLGMFESTPSAYHRPSPENTWSPSNTSLKGHWLHTGLWSNARQDSIQHSSVLWASHASDYLRNRAKRSANPFFLYVGFNAPHDPRQSPESFLKRYPKENIQIPPNYLPEHPFDQGDHQVRDELLAPFPRTKEAVQLHRSEYYSIISHLDEQIGSILNALKESGKEENTYVILTADHGLAVGQHGLMGKQNMYDHSVRVPLLISGPGVPHGKKVDELVYQHSMFATTCELAGIPAPKTVEFPSLADLLKENGAPKHDAIFSYYRGFQRMVRTREHKLIVYPQAGRMQLFALDKDPWETKDLVQDPQYREMKTTLLRRLKQLQEELGDSLQLQAQG